MIDGNIKLKPFLRWAGGKTWLIKHLDSLLPPTGFNRYHEPFLGGASIFFHLSPGKAFLSDLNKDLIDTYIEVRDNVEDVIMELSRFKNNEQFYYDIRNKNFKKKSKKQLSLFILIRHPLMVYIGSIWMGYITFLLGIVVKNSLSLLSYA